MMECICWDREKDAPPEEHAANCPLFREHYKKQQQPAPDPRRGDRIGRADPRLRHGDRREEAE